MVGTNKWSDEQIDICFTLYKDGFKKWEIAEAINGIWPRRGASSAGVNYVLNTKKKEFLEIAARRPGQMPESAPVARPTQLSRPTQMSRPAQIKATARIAAKMDTIPDVTEYEAPPEYRFELYPQVQQSFEDELFVPQFDNYPAPPEFGLEFNAPEPDVQEVVDYSAPPEYQVEPAVPAKTIVEEVAEQSASPKHQPEPVAPQTVEQSAPLAPTVQQTPAEKPHDWNDWSTENIWKGYDLDELFKKETARWDNSDLFDHFDYLSDNEDLNAFFDD
ncbi:uncharacterized protein LY89DRAFT_727243 [Mollisia scopiformis]|uniref:Uncharacterized protein n=1 Tax=Mollisia scopiformis TaxID=149040 RepID=A0A194XWU3_MOLSC|nr:uncharacterized protein LY89DRAFT_727243 [Mollisia scopiformis]KUJ24212.1 hypothetical protein LY89DRAFT_727243 [Mollisia scopiformis]